MPRRRRRKSGFHQKNKSSSQRMGRKPQTVEYLLEKGSLQEMREAKARTQTLIKYHWDYYSELAHQRNQIQDNIKEALISSCISGYKFENWQRAVKWKYGLHPLSIAGSLKNIGQRFNIGSDVNLTVSSFPALYIAFNKDTALQETLGQVNCKNITLTPRELALTSPQSEVIVSVSGEIEKVFDLHCLTNLNKFFDLIKGFKLSETLKKSAASVGAPNPGIVKNPKQLLESLLDPEWRIAPVQFDIPANSQIFGHLIHQAGIEGILYPSKLTGEKCLAIFPHNFLNSSSFISLDDEPPHKSVPRLINSSNWRLCDYTSQELIHGSA